MDVLNLALVLRRPVGDLRDGAIAALDREDVGYTALRLSLLVQAADGDGGSARA